MIGRAKLKSIHLFLHVYHKEILPAFAKKLSYLFSMENPPKLVDINIKKASDFGDLEKKTWSLNYPETLTAFCTVEFNFSQALFEVVERAQRAGFNGKLSVEDLEDLYGEFPMGVPAFSKVQDFDLSTSESEFRDFLQDKSEFWSDNPDYSIYNIDFDLSPAKVTFEDAVWPKGSQYPLVLTLTYNIEFKVSVRFDPS